VAAVVKAARSSFAQPAGRSSYNKAILTRAMKRVKEKRAGVAGGVGGNVAGKRVRRAKSLAVLNGESSTGSRVNSERLLS
jgi:hypothetical protein